MKFSQKEMNENVKARAKRFSLYLKHGYDQAKSRKFILKKAGRIRGSVLEVGTGKGYLAVLLAKKFKSIVTVDISREEQRSARLNAASENVSDRIKFKICDAAKLPFPDSSFDLVISVNAFHHFVRPFAVLKEMIRTCKKRLVISDFNSEGFELVRRMHRDEGREHEEHHGDLEIVGVYLREHGFSVKKHNGHCQIVYVADKTNKKGR